MTGTCDLQVGHQLHGLILLCCHGVRMHRPYESYTHLSNQFTSATGSVEKKSAGRQLQAFAHHRGTRRGRVWHTMRDVADLVFVLVTPKWKIDTLDISSTSSHSHASDDVALAEGVENLNFDGMGSNSALPPPMSKEPRTHAPARPLLRSSCYVSSTPPPSSSPAHLPSLPSSQSFRPAAARTPPNGIPPVCRARWYAIGCRWSSFPLDACRRTSTPHQTPIRNRVSDVAGCSIPPRPCVLSWHSPLRTAHSRQPYSRRV